MDTTYYLLIEIYTPSIKSEKYVRILLTNSEKHMDGNMIAVGDFNTLLSSLDKFIRQNTSTEPYQTTML